MTQAVIEEARPVLEMRAIREAAQDVSATYGLPVLKSADAISVLFTKYAR